MGIFWENQPPLTTSITSLNVLRNSSLHDNPTLIHPIITRILSFRAIRPVGDRVNSRDGSCWAIYVYVVMAPWSSRHAAAVPFLGVRQHVSRAGMSVAASKKAGEYLVEECFQHRQRGADDCGVDLNT